MQKKLTAIAYNKKDTVLKSKYFRDKKHLIFLSL